MVGGSGQKLSIQPKVVNKDGKSKKQVPVDDGHRRKSSRHQNDDKATLDKAMERARMKNLEQTGIPSTAFPTVLCTENVVLIDLANKVGVNIGQTIDEVDNNLKVIKDLEQARTSVYLTNLKSSNEQVHIQNSKVDSFDPETLNELYTSSEDDQDEDMVDYFTSVFINSMSKTKREVALEVSVLNPRLEVEKRKQVNLCLVSFGMQGA